MAIGIQDFRMAIRINNAEAKKSLAEMSNKIEELRGELKKLDADGKKETTAYKEKKEQLDALNTKYYTHRTEAGLIGMTYNDLRKGARSLQAQMNNTVPNTPKWIEFKEELAIVKNRMSELRGQATQAQFSLRKLADGFNRYAAISAGFIASITGMTLAVRKSVDDFAALEESEANVRKYTGMTRDEVKDLNEEFKKMDTRTARVELNALASDAGKLGITTKKELLEFAEAGNIIRVSLGEDLGKDAIKNIGKLAQMFGDAESMGLKNAMLAVGSAINEVAQNSSAAEPYLVDFTARLAGVGNQANISVSNIIGYASVLDQNMQKVEMSATALQGVIMKMFKDPERLAKIAGIEVKRFADLVKNDANEALLLLLDTLGKKGGMDKLAPIFDEMKLDGARAASVLSVLAGNIKKVRNEQELATQAYKEGTSVINEYNVINNTLQAEIEKAKKKFQEIRYEIGEKLAPHMKSMITSGGMLVRFLLTATSILFKYGTTIATTAAILGTYITIQKVCVLWTERHTKGTLLNTIALNARQIKLKANIAAEKLHAAAIAFTTGRMSLATRMLKQFFAALKVHPIAAIITVVLTLGVALYKLGTRTTEAQKALKTFFEQSKKEQTELRKLIEATKLATEGTKRRKELIDEINTKYGDYLPNLLNEYSSLKDIEQAYKDINVAMEKNIAKKVMDEKIESIQTEALDKQSKQMLTIREKLEKTLPKSQIPEVLRNITKATTVSIEAGNKADSTTEAILANLRNRYGVHKAYMRSALKDYVEIIEETTEKVEEVKKEFDPFLPTEKKKQTNELAEVEVVAEDLSGTNGNNDTPDDSKLKKYLQQREEQLKQAMQIERNLWKEDLIAKKVTEEEYQQAMYDTESMFLLSKKALLEKYKQDTSQVQGQILDSMIAESNRRYQEQLKLDKQNQDADLKALDASYSADRSAIKEAYLNGEIRTEKEFQAKMKEAEQDYLQSRIEMLKSFGKDVSKETDKITDNQLADKKEAKEKDKKDKLNEIDATSGLDNKLNLLKAMYDADLISYEEYQKSKTDITEEHEKLREETQKATLMVISQAASAASDMVGALMNREISQVTSRYDKEIAAARKAGKDTTKLEEQKEEEINEIKKKYADKQFAAAVLQITATTAVTAMEAYKAMAGIKVVGPALGAAAAAAAIAAGSAQIMIAKQQRDEAKGLKSGGYSDEYVEGYTTTGNPDDVAGVIPVHENEFVGNHEGVANPHVKQFYDIFDVAQKNGSIRMLNTTQILEQVRTRSGKYSGGFTDDNYTSDTTTDLPSFELNAQNVQKLIVLMTENNRLLNIISKKDLNIDGRQLRKRLQEIDTLERNVSRK